MSTPARRKAPSFKAPSSSGGDVSLDDYRGKYLVLYFYPRSFTPGCTIETKAFRDASEELHGLGAEVVGVSGDTLETQCKFAEQYGGNFPILSDADGSISRAYDVVFPLVGFIKRVTFVIDPEGCIAARFHHELLVTKHIADVVAFLKSVR